MRPFRSQAEGPFCFIKSVCEIRFWLLPYIYKSIEAANTAEPEEEIQKKVDLPGKARHS